MDLASFRIKYPEFVNASDTLVSAFLDDASRSLSVDVFGDRWDDAHGVLTAHMIALSPFGKNARLQSAQGKTTYQDRWERMVFEATCGLARVT